MRHVAHILRGKKTPSYCRKCRWQVTFVCERQFIDDLIDEWVMSYTCVLQFVAVCGSVLQYVVVCYDLIDEWVMPYTFWREKSPSHSWTCRLHANAKSSTIWLLNLCESAIQSCRTCSDKKKKPSYSWKSRCHANAKSSTIWLMNSIARVHYTRAFRLMRSKARCPNRCVWVPGVTAVRCSVLHCVAVFCSVW